MKKLIFVETIDQVREFCQWIDRVEKAGLDLNNKYLDQVTQVLQFLLKDGRPNWDYDEKEGFNWILEYISDLDFTETYKDYHRAGIVWHLTTASNLYDFLLYMNETGWKE